MPVNFRFEGGRKLTREITASRMNAILQELQRLRPLPGRGLTARQEQGGVRLDILTEPQNSGAKTSNRLPFDIYIVDKGEGSYTVKVYPGLVGGLLCVNWDDEFVLDDEELVYGVVNATTDGQYITEATIEFQSEPPDPQTPELYQLPASVAFLFGIFKQGKPYNLIQDDLPASPNIVFVVANADAQPGQTPYDLYYALT